MISVVSAGGKNGKLMSCQSRRLLPLYPPPPPPAVQAPPPPPKPPKVDQLSLDRAKGHEDPPSAPSTRDLPVLKCGLGLSFQPPPPPSRKQT